jgi:hypothetical protein
LHWVVLGSMPNRRISVALTSTAALREQLRCKEFEDPDSGSWHFNPPAASAKTEIADLSRWGTP